VDEKANTRARVIASRARMGLLRPQRRDIDVPP